MLILKSIDDPRDALDKATRVELREFAKSNGLKELHFGAVTIPIAEAGSELLRKGLRQAGLTQITPSPRPFALPDTVQKAGQPADQNVPATDATEDMIRQYAAMTQPDADPPSPPSPPPPPPPPPPPAMPTDEFSNMTMPKLRKLCKEAGIAQGRHDKADLLRDKMRALRNGQNAA